MVLTIVHVLGYFILFLFSYTVMFQLWARVSNSEVADLIRFPAFCVWLIEIPILVIGAFLVVRFGSLISIYIGVIYLGFYFTLFQIDYFTGQWRYYKPSEYLEEILDKRRQLRTICAERKERLSKSEE